MFLRFAIRLAFWMILSCRFENCPLWILQPTSIAFLGEMKQFSYSKKDKDRNQVICFTLFPTIKIKNR